MDDFTAVKQPLEKHNIDLTNSDALMPTSRQIWAMDPNGIKVELNFC